MRGQSKHLNDMCNNSKNQTVNLYTHWRVQIGGNISTKRWWMIRRRLYNLETFPTENVV